MSFGHFPDSFPNFYRGQNPNFSLDFQPKLLWFANRARYLTFKTNALSVNDRRRRRSLRPGRIRYRFGRLVSEKKCQVWSPF